LKSLFDKLNLRPNERRLVTIVAIVVFIILNAIFVWPRFGDWGKLNVRRDTATRTLAQYQAEVDKIPLYQKQLADLEKQGVAVASEDQALKLATTVQQQAALSGVEGKTYNDIRQTTSGLAKPNQFFEERSGVMSIVAEEKNLVDFLYNLGVGGSLIRVRTMTLNPDPARQKLMGNVTFVASYAKKAPPKVTPPSTPARTNVPVTTAANTHSTNAAARSGLFGSRTTNTAKK
jgi:hypothetical protein